MNLDAVLEQFNKQAGNTSPIGGTIKFVIDGQSIYIDGSGDTNTVSAEDKDADCTISTSFETLQKLQSGDLNPMMAVMGGKIKISGDMGLAMKLQNLIS